MLPTWLRGAAPGYGRRSSAPGGTVLVRSTAPGATKPSTRRVSLAPAFDPDATSMVPVPGWTAAGVAASPFRAPFPATFRPLGKAA